MSSPFARTAAQPGAGTIHLALLPPNTPRLQTIKYQYPLKLVSPAALLTQPEEPSAPSHLIHTVYLLTYGGGLVAGDCIDLAVVLERNTRLVLLTQGSTKLFKSPSREVVSRQGLTVDLAPGAALCFLPDPVQPFRDSCFAQTQIYRLSLPSADTISQEKPSLCVLDWVSNGRPANGENWDFHHYASRNEVYLCHRDSSSRKLLLRDSLSLDGLASAESIAQRMHGLAVYATLILYGPLFARLGAFFMEEFRALPRLGARKWADDEDGGDEDAAQAWRSARQRTETQAGLLWSAASVRGCVVVKFGAPGLEDARRWVCGMLQREGSVVREFGERALLCLRW